MATDVGANRVSVPVYAYALNNPLHFTDPTGLAVYLCKRKADIAGNPGFKHHWIVTTSGGAAGSRAGVVSPGTVDLIRRTRPRPATTTTPESR